MNRINWKTVRPATGPHYLRGYSGVTSIFTIQYSLTAKEKYFVKSSLPKTAMAEVDSFEEGKIKAEEIFDKWLQYSNLMYVNLNRS